MWEPMAIAIIFGLLFATLLTLGVVPVLYSFFFRVSFKDFMELALYHPEAGYYTRPRPAAGPVGPRGDFITAPTAAPLLADTVARLLRRLAAACGEPVVFVELAAGEGLFLERLCGAAGAPGAGRSG